MDSETKDNLLESPGGTAQSDTGQTPPVASKHASEEDTAKAIAEKYGLDFVKLSEMNLSPHIVRLLPEWLVTEHNVIAVKFEEDILYVATTNPLDLPALDQINMVTGFNVKPMVSTEREIIQAVSRHYGVEQTTKQDIVDFRFGREQMEQAYDEKIEDLTVTEQAGQVVRLTNSIIKDAIDSLASDVHFEPADDDMVVRFRVDGILHDIMTIPTAMKKEIISRVKVLAKLDITERRRAQDGHINLRHKGNDYDLRVSVMPTIDGEKIVVRILDKSRLSIDLATLGINKEDLILIEEAVNRPYGMILVTGPTGSGKTTTLYAMLRSINAIEKNVITIENPVEYKLDRINQIQIDPGNGETFAGALRSIVRQDPDVIMVGEIRDLETAEIAIQAALTGHLVLATLHTNDAVTAITRLRELGIASFLIASGIVMAVAQRLVRKICPDCKRQYQPEGQTLKLLGVDKNTTAKFVHGKGCNYCFNTGFRGREGVFEILKADEDVRNAILADENALAIKKTAVKKGMKTLLDSAILKVFEGQTSVEEVKRVIAPERF